MISGVRQDGGPAESPCGQAGFLVYQLLRPWHRQAGNTEPDSLCPLPFCMCSSASRFQGDLWIGGDLQPDEGLWPTCGELAGGPKGQAQILLAGQKAGRQTLTRTGDTFSDLIL